MSSLALMTCHQATAQPADDQPNIVIIVADDLGYSDIGSFGGEIRTPNLDRLAAEGVRFTNFYVGASCSPTRSMLMSGMDNHRVGMGNMYERTAPNQIDQPGYEGVLNLDAPTFAERLKEAGYRTYMSGKWHLGHEPDFIPAARGFDRDFSLLNAAGSHFNTTGSRIENEENEFTRDGEYTQDLPRNYYSTRTFTEEMIGFLSEDLGSDKPFVAYLAYQAPHDPLQVPDDWLWKYKTEFDTGWDRLREDRLERMKAMGLVAPSADNAPRLWYVPEYEDLTRAGRVASSRKMEVYASVVEYLDWQVGEFIDYLGESGQLENTIILFFSDNGPEGADPIPAARRQTGLDASMFFANNYDAQIAAWGRDYGFLAYGPPWAQVSATPFDGYKGSLYEGGIRSPLIVWQPGRENAGAINRDALLHVMDVAPTLVDLAGGDPSDMQGRSWVELLDGEVTLAHHLGTKHLHRDNVVCIAGRGDLAVEQFDPGSTL
ncbi:MAG: arylsulfatase, partial [Pseudomonadota bacterium]